MTVRRLRFYGDSERNAVKAALSRCVQKWADGSLEGLGFVSSVNDPTESLTNNARKWAVLSGATGRIAYSTTAGFSRQLAFAAGWCDTELAIKPSKLWELTVDDCIETLIQSVLQDFTKGTADEMTEAPSSARQIEADKAWSQRASGYLWSSIALGRESLDLVIDPASIEALLGMAQISGTKAKLTGRRNAIADRRCQVQVISGSVEITIGELNGLSPGQIIQLDRRIDQAFDIVAENGQILAKAHLATCGSKKAVQLVKI